jgi:hypothetical protein
MGVLVGPGTPYITPEVLMSAPTGIDWDTVPDRRASPREKMAEVSNICLRGTGLIEGITNQVLRATVDTELFIGPDYRVTVQNQTGVGRIVLSRWPILAIVSGKMSASFQFPRVWQNIAANQMDIEKPPIGIFGAAQAADVPDGDQAILLAPGLVNWWQGRNGWRYSITYVNGWPHTSLTAAATAGSTTVQVDDVTGWAPSVYDPIDSVDGAAGIWYDGFKQEVSEVTSASTTAGPGTLTLATPLAWDHDPGTLFTTMSRTVMNATIDMCTSLALARGASATTVQSMSGGGSNTGGPIGVVELRKLATDAVHSYARVI